MSAPAAVATGLLSAALLLAPGLVLQAALSGDGRLLDALAVPAMPTPPGGEAGARPVFADLRTIPPLSAMGDAAALRIENPFDPWGRPFNYPQIWAYLLAPFALFGDRALAFGLAQAAALALAALLLLRRLGPGPAQAAVVLVALSPPVLLLLERGNTDATVFLLVLGAALTRRSVLGGALMMLAAGLKLFPAAGLPGLLTVHPLRRVGLGALLAAPALLWALSDMGAALQATPSSPIASFGLQALAQALALAAGRLLHLAPAPGLCLGLSAAVFALCTLAFGLRFRPRYAALALALGPRQRLVFACFLAVFLFVFLSASNWAYRIVFLAPLVVLFVRQTGGLPWRDPFRLIGTALFALAFWSPLLPQGWLLFNGFAFLAAAFLAPMAPMLARIPPAGPLSTSPQESRRP